MINCYAMALPYMFGWVFMTVTQNKGHHLKIWITAGSQIRLQDSLSMSQVLYYFQLITKIAFIILSHIIFSTIYQPNYYSLVWHA